MFSQKQGWLNQGLTNSDDFWVVTYTATGTGNPYFAGPAITDLNGNTYSYGASGRPYFAKINNNAQRIWSQEISALGSPITNDICLDSTESNVYVCGSNSSSGYGAWVMKVNSAGTVQWRRQLTGGTGIFTDFNDIAVDNLDNIYLVGRVSTSTTYGFLITKYDAAGNLLWQKITNLSTITANLESISIDSNNNLCVCGQFDVDAMIIKLDSSGNIIWQKIISTIQEIKGKFDSSGNIYVTGGTFDGINSSCITIKYDTNGNILWQRQYFGNNNAYGRNLTLNSSGNIYIIGGIGSTSLILQYNDLGVLSPIQITLSNYRNQISVDSLNNIYTYGGGFYNASFPIVTSKISNNGILRGTYYTFNKTQQLTMGVINLNDNAASCTDSISNISFISSSYTSSNVSVTLASATYVSWLITM